MRATKSSNNMIILLFTLKSLFFIHCDVDNRLLNWRLLKKCAPFIFPTKRVEVMAAGFHLADLLSAEIS